MSKITWVKRLIYLLLIVVPIHFSISTPFISDVKFLDIAVGVFLILFIYLFNRLRERSLYILWDKIDISIYLYIIISGIGIALSGNPIQSIRNYLLFFAFIILFYIGRDIFREKDLLTLKKISISITTLVSLYAIAQFYGYYLLFVPKGAPIISFLGNPNFAANFVAINTPILLGYMIDKPFIGTLLFAISYAALVMFSARGALLGFIFGFFLFFWWTKKKGYIVLKPLILSLSIIILVSFIYSTPNPLNQRSLPLWNKLQNTKEFLAKAENTGSIRARLTFWKVTLLMIKDHPLKGVGPGRFGYLYPFYQAKILKEDKALKKHAYNAKRVHNEYLQVLVETGVFGFLVFLLILYFLLQKGYKRLKNSENIMYISLAGGILVLLVHAFFSFPWHLAASMLYFAIFSAFLVGEGRKKREIRSQTLVIVIYFLLITFTAFSFAYSAKSYVARLYLGKGKIDLLRSIRAKEPEPFVKEGYRKILIANYLDPYDPLSAFYLAKVYQYGKRYDKAIEYYKKFLKMYSDYNALFNMGKCYLNMGDIKNAIKTFEKLRALKPDYEDLYYFLGIAYIEAKDYKRAIDILKEGLIYEKKKVPIYINLAISYKKTGDLEMAMKCLEDAKKLDPKNPNIDRYIEELKKEMERGTLSTEGLFEVFDKRRSDMMRIKNITNSIIKNIYREYGICTKHPFHIIVTETSLEFEKKVGISGLYGGATIGDTIYLKPLPLIEKYGSLREVLIHEYIHILLNSMGEDKPLWVQEGFAVYLSGMKRKFIPKKFEFIPVTFFPKRGYSKNIYHNAYIKVIYLIKKYGFEKFIDFSKKVDYYNEKEVFKEIFGLTEEEFDKTIKKKIGGINE